MLYIQIAAAIISLLLGITQMTKESAPLVGKIQQSHQQAVLQRQQMEAHKKAQMIASMNINWQYRGNDGVWRYYSDVTGRYWFRTDIQGVQEYCEHPQVQIASNPHVVR